MLHGQKRVQSAFRSLYKTLTEAEQQQCSLLFKLLFKKSNVGPSKFKKLISLCIA